MLIKYHMTIQNLIYNLMPYLWIRHFFDIRMLPIITFPFYFFSAVFKLPIYNNGYAADYWKLFGLSIWQINIYCISPPVVFIPGQCIFLKVYVAFLWHFKQWKYYFFLMKITDFMNPRVNAFQHLPRIPFPLIRKWKSKPGSSFSHTRIPARGREGTVLQSPVCKKLRELVSRVW